MPDSFLLANCRFDKLSKVYQYDNFVPTHRQITEGDLVLLQGRDKLFGVARIERIDACEGTKKRLRCPVCGTTKLNRRKVLSPEFRCYKGNHEFDTPVKEVVACMLFTAHFGDSFVPAEEAVSIEALRQACLKYNGQLAIQLLDFGRIEAALITRVPDVQQLLATHGISE